jgi:predicted ATPase
LSTTGYFHLEASRVRRAGSGRQITRIGYGGEDLPDFLASLKNEPQTAETFERIVTDLRELLPTTEELLILRTDVERQTFGLRFRGQRGYIAAPDLSDGTLFTLGLLCILRGPQPPSLLCIEEPETGLHPRRLRWLFERLVRLAHPDEGERPVQVLLTTHAPHLLDLFHEMPSAVQVVELEQGHSRVTPLPEILTRLHADTSDAVGIGPAWAAGLYEGL